MENNNMNNIVPVENNNNMNNTMPVGNGKMREKYTRIWTWMGIPGFIVALTAGNREEELTKNHINHAIGVLIVYTGLGLISALFAIPYLGWLLALFLFLPCMAAEIYGIVVTIMGIVKACHDQPVNFFIFNKFHIIK